MTDNETDEQGKKTTTDKEISAVQTRDVTKVLLYDDFQLSLISFSFSLFWACRGAVLHARMSDGKLKLVTISCALSKMARSTDLHAVTHAVQARQRSRLSIKTSSDDDRIDSGQPARVHKTRVHPLPRA